MAAREGHEGFYGEEWAYFRTVTPPWADGINRPSCTNDPEQAAALRASPNHVRISYEEFEALVDAIRNSRA